MYQTGLFDKLLYLQSLFLLFDDILRKLYDGLATAESEVYGTAESVDRGDVNEYHRPAVSLVQNIAGEVDSEKTRHRADAVHKPENTARVSRREIGGINNNGIAVKSGAPDNQCEAQYSPLKRFHLHEQQQVDDSCSEADTLNDFPRRRYRVSRTDELLG